MNVHMFLHENIYHVSDPSLTIFQILMYTAVYKPANKMCIIKKIKAAKIRSKNYFIIKNIFRAIFFIMLYVFGHEYMYFQCHCFESNFTVWYRT